MSEQSSSLKDKVELVKVAGDLLEKAPIHKTKKAAGILREKTEILVDAIVDELETLKAKVNALEGGCHAE